MCCDWNRINDLIVSGGEDCIYKVWDAYGRQLFQSQPNAYVTTATTMATATTIPYAPPQLNHHRPTTTPQHSHHHSHHPSHHPHHRPESLYPTQPYST